MSAASGLHVVHVTEVLGGIETYLRLVMRHWGTDTRFSFVLGGESLFTEHLRAHGHEVAVVAMPRTNTRIAELRAARELRTVLDRLDPDVIHLHSSLAGFVGRLACRRSVRARVVYTPHAYYYLGRTGVARRIYLAAEILLARLFPTDVLATSPSEHARAIGEVRVPAARASWLLNAVEIVDPHASTGPFDSAGRFRVGLVGRISAQKNIAMYMRVIRRLSEEHPGVFDFCLIGIGHYANDDHELDRLLAENGVDPSWLTIIEWLPHDDLLAWLGSCQVAVLTSTYESFGYTLAEASARCVVVVGTDVDGIRDVIADGVSGHLVPLDDDAAMSRRIQQVMTDDGLRARLASGGVTRVKSLMNISTFVTELSQYYERG